MRRGPILAIAAAVALLAVAGCGGNYLLQGERAAWRHEAEETCIKSGAVKIGVVQIDPIEGPGMCGMDFPLRVSALAEDRPAMSYADDLRPPGSIPNAASGMPNWPPSQPSDPPARVAPSPDAPAHGEILRWVPGPPGIDISHERDEPAQAPMPLTPGSEQAPARYDSAPPYQSAPQYVPPRNAPQAYPQRPSSRARPDDIPDDAVVPAGGSAGAPERRSYNAPQSYQTPAREPPRLGPSRTPNLSTVVTPAALQPAATLACPLVSALDRWVSEGVQPAALHWFGSPVSEIHQIGGYSCRGMVGGDGVSEHSFGNALDIAAFTLADGRKITVKNGWHGSPEEQGFLHDVQLYACETFTTVLAPGYNIYHYDHIHVDLMRRRPGYRPCRPEAIPGEVVAARVRAHYAAQRRGPAYTGSIGRHEASAPAVPGADGYVTDEEANKPSPPLATPSYLGGRSVHLPGEERLTVH